MRRPPNRWIVCSSPHNPRPRSRSCCGASCKYRKKCQFLHQIHSTSYNISSLPTLSSGAVPSCCPQIRLDTGEFLLRGNNSRAEEVGSRLMCYTATSHCGTLGACTVECLRLGPAPTLCLVCILPFLSIFTWGSLQIPKYNIKLLFWLRKQPNKS